MVVRFGYGLDIKPEGLGPMLTTHPGSSKTQSLCMGRRHSKNPGIDPKLIFT